MIRRWLLPLLAGILVAAFAWQATLVAFPRGLMALTVSRVKAPAINHFTYSPLATVASRAIVRPSPDLAYSSCPFDLSVAPVLVEVPPVSAPYWSLSVFDAHTDVAFVRNNLQAAGKPVRIAIARAGQAVPPGVETVRVDGRRGIALIRILIDRRADFSAIDRARRTAHCAPLTG